VAYNILKFYTIKTHIMEVLKTYIKTMSFLGFL
jgi:hypothetical protein